MPLVAVASGGICRNQVFQAPPTLTADTKEIATKQGHDGRQLEGCCGLLQGQVRGLALMHNTGFVTSSRPAAGMGIGAGFRIPRAGRAEDAQTGSWGSITAVPTALQNPSRSKRTVPVPPVTTPFKKNVPINIRKLNPQSCPPSPRASVTPSQPCHLPPAPSWQPVTLSTERCHCTTTARLEQHVLAAPESCHDHSEFHKQQRATLFSNNNN